MSTMASYVETISFPGWREHARRLRALLVQGFVLGAAMFSEMPFLDHLDELRNRIIKSIVAVGATLLVCVTYASELIEFLKIPADRVGIHLIAIGGTEIFSVYFKASLACAICLAAPFLLCQIWEFIAPGLHKHERRYAGPFLISTTFSFIGGAAFGFLVLLPLALGLQLSMAEAVGISLPMSAMSYFDLLSMVVISMGVIFEIPAVIFLLSRIGLITASFLARNFKYAILLSFIAAAILTPSTDMSTMTLVAVPMIGLYAVGIVVAWVFGRPRKVEA